MGVSPSVRPVTVRRLSPQHQLLSLFPCRLSSGLCHLTPGPPPSSIGCLSPPYPPLVTTASAACLRCMMASIHHPLLVTVACASVVCPLWVPRLSPPHRSHVAAVSSSFPYSICHLSPPPSLLASVLTASVPSCRVSCPRRMCIRQLSPAAPLLVPTASVKCPHCIRRLSLPHLSHVPAASVSIACRLPHPSPPIPSHAPAASRVCGLTQPPPLLVPAASAPCPRRVRCLFLSLRPLTPPAGTARPVRQLDLLQHGLHCSPGRFELYTPYMCIIQTSASILKCMTLCLPHPSPCSYNVLESKLVRRSRQARLTTTAPPLARTDSDTRT